MTIFKKIADIVAFSAIDVLSEMAQKRQWYGRNSVSVDGQDFGFRFYYSVAGFGIEETRNESIILFDIESNLFGKAARPHIRKRYPVRVQLTYSFERDMATISVCVDECIAAFMADSGIEITGHQKLRLTKSINNCEFEVSSNYAKFAKSLVDDVCDKFVQEYNVEWTFN